MGEFKSVKARQLLKALLRIGWVVKRHNKGSHRRLAREGYPDYVFAFHDKVEVPSSTVKRVALATGLKPEDL